jgi:uncharacterized damage-inducible protein DinB
MTTVNREQRLIQPPAGFAPEVAQWVWALQDTRQRTKQTLAGLTDVATDWVPPEGGNSIGMLLYHLMAIEMSYLYEDILEIGWSAELEPLIVYGVRDDEGKLSLVQGEPLATHLHRLDSARSLLLAALGKMTPDDLRRPRFVEQYEVTPEWIFHHLMQHEAEHRGQIGDLRLRAEQLEP